MLYSSVSRIGRYALQAKPTYKCSQLSDKFTVSSSVGNGALKYPVALASMDELVFAGIKGTNGSDKVEKKKLPTQSEICQIIGIKSRTTYNTHMKYLIAKEYVKEIKKGLSESRSLRVHEKLDEIRDKALSDLS